MSYFTATLEQQDEGISLLDESSRLHRSASESESMSEILELTLAALDKDLEAFSLLWEATLVQKRKIEELRHKWESELRRLEVEVLDINP